MHLLIGLSTWSTAASDTSLSASDVLPVFVEQSLTEDSSAHELLQLTKTSCIADNVLLLSHMKATGNDQISSLVTCEMEVPYVTETCDSSSIVCQSFSQIADDGNDESSACNKFVVGHQPASECTINNGDFNYPMPETKDSEMVKLKRSNKIRAPNSATCLPAPEIEDTGNTERHICKSTAVFCNANCQVSNVRDCKSGQTSTYVTISKCQGVSVIGDAQMSQMPHFCNKVACEASVVQTVDLMSSSDSDDKVTASCQPSTTDAVGSDYTVDKSVHEADNSCNYCYPSSGEKNDTVGYSDEPVSEVHCNVVNKSKFELGSTDDSAVVVGKELLDSIVNETGRKDVLSSSHEDSPGSVDFVEMPLTEIMLTDTIHASISTTLTDCKCGEQVAVAGMSVSDSVLTAATGAASGTVRPHANDLVDDAAGLADSILQQSVVTSLQKSEQLSNFYGLQFADPNVPATASAPCSLEPAEFELKVVSNVTII
jgi:hypothetical protein